MIGRADIEGSKSNVAMNAWLPQASYPCGNFSDTSTFEFRRSKGSLGHAFTTSLAYIVPSTRGYSPWRPDAFMSTTGRGRHSVLWIFKGRQERTRHHATCGAIPAAGPYLRLSRFQGGQAVKQKRQLFPRLPSTSPDFLMLPSTATSPFRSAVHPSGGSHLSASLHLTGILARRLAHMSDSLVRV
ncbi:hypothetical protein CQW23_33749 [Capsicum baccatum]|uniref:Senescence-associated protein n=1 Tax=Capsicum baccatum TaxID=33114 RepID=A0A2G2V126_CAPBA|nr:hypothetical protein CQW23_33749 [Capsicum baccatum]